MSLGQLLGAGGGLVLGAVLAGPLGFTGAGIIQALAYGATLGSIAGGLIDPPRLGNEKAQHEIHAVTYNTYDHDLPVAVLFGKRKITGNIIFVGDTYGQVEDVGDQQVGQGKAEQEVDIFKVIYYADFIIGLGEGPFQDFLHVFQDRIDVTANEGRIFTFRKGESTEEVPDIMQNSPNPVIFPTGYSNTAQVIWSGKIGEINHIPSIEVEAVGPALTYTYTGTPENSLPGNITAFLYDDISELVIAQTSTTDFYSFKRDGTEMVNTGLPSGYTIEKVFFDGRRATVVVFTNAVNGAKWMLVGELGFQDGDDWQLVPMGVTASQSNIRGWCIDDGKGIIMTTYITAQGVVVVRTDIQTFVQTETVLPADTTNMTIRGTYYDKIEEQFYLLFTQSGSMTIKRLLLDYPSQGEEMTMDTSYQWSNPIGIAVTGDLITIFDTGLDQPVVQFEWGRVTKRYDRGFKFTVASFTPDHIDDLEVWYAADLETGLVNGNPVTTMTDQSGNGLDATQPTASKQPLYQTNVVNSKSVYRFDGSNDFMKAINMTLDRQNITVFVVHKPTGLPAEERVLLRTDNAVDPGNNSHYIALGGSDSIDYTYDEDDGETVHRSGYVWQSQEGTYFSRTFYPFTASEWVISEFMGDDDGYTTWKNGTEIGTHRNVNLGTLDVTLWIGSHSGGGEDFYKGDIAEILIYDRPLDDDEREKVEMYLRRKYAILYSPTDPLYSYFGIGDRMTYANPVQFFFADQIQAMFVLDLTATGWFLSWCHWNGDNWSYIRQTSFNQVFFEEDGTAGGCLWALFTHERYGIGGSPLLVDLPKLERLSGFCNRPVDMRYYTNDEVTYEAAYRVNYLLAANKKLSQIVREILTAINGYIFDSNGRVSFLIDRDNGIVEFEDDADTILEGSFEFWEVAREDKWNRVRIEVDDDRNDYKATPVQDTAEWEKDVYQEVRNTTINAQAITRLRQGVFVARNSLLGQTMRRYACRYKVGAQGLQREVGDIGTVTHWKPEWVKKKFIIIAISETEDDEMEVTCLEHVPNIHTAQTYPLQQPQVTLELTPGTEGSFADVHQATRMRILEDTLEGRAFLLASKPTNSGPWKFLRWYAKWVQSLNPGAQFYPGSIPFPSTEYMPFMVTADFTASGLLKTDMTSSQLTIELSGVSADPPESNFDILIYDTDITAVQFGNANGNGQYERCQGALYDPSTKIVTLDAGGRGYGTNALAHVVTNINVGATYVRSQNQNGVTIKYQDNSITNVSSAPNPLLVDGDEWYIGFDSSGFSAPNAINVLVSQIAGGNFPSPGSQPALDFEVYYSSGQGLWTKLESINDDTHGFDNSGRVSWDPPTDWATTTQYIPGTASYTYFRTYVVSGTAPIAAARYYLKFKRIQNLKQLPNFTISLVGQSNYSSVGSKHPIVYFLKHNSTPFYDTLASEQGYSLSFKAQPIGHHSQTIDVEDLREVQKTFANLAGEGG